MNYQECLNYLYTQLPMFQRIGAAAYKADLKNIHALCEILQHPERKLKFIHIAGTNGKGSVSNMLAAVFQKNGYKTGLFTSPHLIDFRERIRIDGKMIPKQYITHFVNKYKSAFDNIKPSFFEWTTALAFQYFYDKKVDIVILETGMGGRLDSTNVVLPELSIITNIGEDHKQFLGDTLQKIAFEKAGIIKEYVPVLISEFQKEVYDVFVNMAKERNAPLIYSKDIIKITGKEFKRDFLEISFKINYTNLNLFLDKSKFNYKINQNNKLDKSKYKFSKNKKNNLSKSKKNTFTVLSSLIGTYQVNNIRCVLAACEILGNLGWNLNRRDIFLGIRYTPKLTGFSGRWEVIQKRPYIIADIGHNKPGIQQTLKNLKNYSYQTLRIVFGVVSDKEVDEILALLPKNAVYYITQASVPRAMPVNILYEKMIKNKFRGLPYSTVSEAIYNAQKDANTNDLILITGSAFVVADVIAYLQKKKIV